MVMAASCQPQASCLDLHEGRLCPGQDAQGSSGRFVNSGGTQEVLSGQEQQELQQW